MEGGDALGWSANLELVSQGIQDITAGLSYGLNDSMSVAADLACRPSPKLHSYSADGEYISAAGGSVADYPPAIVLVSFSYTGDPVTE